MLLLLFHIGENLYAIDTDRVVEIVPMVLLRPVQSAPEHIAGVFNYRGEIVPVIDLCTLIRGTPCQTCYSSRMVMVNYDADRELESEKRDRQRRFGLIAERVTGTLKISDHQIESAERISNSPYLGELFVNEQGMIQKVNWERLIHDADQAALSSTANGQANGAGRN